MTYILDTLDRIVDDVMSLNTKLVLLFGPPKSGKSDLLQKLAARKKMQVMQVGTAFGHELLLLPSAQRHLRAAEIFKQLSGQFVKDELLILDNIEILFDLNLHLNPLEMLKRFAHSHRIVAAWPGELGNNRVSYAPIDHPEHQDYAVDGLVPFKL